MNIKEFGKWSSHHISDSDSKYSVDEYNRSFFKERFDCPGEYDNSNYAEYYHVPGMHETDYTKQRDSSQSDQKKKERTKRNLQKNMMRQVVCLVAGSVVVTTSYQSVIQQQKQQQSIPVSSSVVQTDDTKSDDPQQDLPIDPEEESPVEPEDTPTGVSSTWEWGNDYQTATLKFSDPQGNLIKEIPATVQISETAATCNQAGLKTYTATASDEETTYSDSHEETIAPLGHSFDEGKETVLENGQTAKVFECARCHEQFTIATSMSEND